jgi:hypothetical protein
MANTRYFNLKEGNKKVRGMVIRVCLSAPLEKRLSEITGAVFEAKLSYYSLDSRTGDEEAQYLVDLTGNRARKKSMVLGIDKKGTLKVYETPRIESKIFLDEISPRVAKDMKEEAHNWRLQQGYFEEGCL